MWTLSASLCWRRVRSVLLGLAVKCSSRVGQSLTNLKVRLKAWLARSRQLLMSCADFGIGLLEFGIASLVYLAYHLKLMMFRKSLFSQQQKSLWRKRKLQQTQMPNFSKCRLCMKSVSNWASSLTFSSKSKHTTRT